MPTLHTLGPDTTDSYKAAEYLKQVNPIYQDTSIELHDSFESIYTNLADFAGDFFLVPVAYNDKNGDNWGTNNYRYWNQLKVVDTFHLPTMKMILAENEALSNHTAIIHAATNELLDQFESATNQQLETDYVPSKPLAQKEFEAGQYQYAIFSKQGFEPHATFKILQEYQPEMVWCLYQIKKDTL
ncbi:hypothetical protein ACYATM_03855 [Lactobacillaceae bacterium Scapto_B20]